MVPPILLTTYAYAPILRNYFIADDFIYLYRVRNAPFDEFFLAPHAGHLCIARNLVFFLSWLAFGVDPAPYFTCVLLTHVINVVLFFLLLERMTGSPPLASIGSTLWGCMAAHAGTLGWYSVYGQVLSCTAVLVLLLSATRRSDPPPSIVRVAWYALALVAATSFGTGLGVVIALPAALVALRPSLRGRLTRLPPLTPLVVALPLLWLALIWRYDAQSPWSVNDTLVFVPRGETDPTTALSATLLQRLLHLHVDPSTLLMLVDLIGHGTLAVLVGPIALSNPPAWLTRLTAALVLMGTIVTACKVRSYVRRRLIAFGIIAVGAYFAVAFGRGHVFYWHPPFVGRYHYLATIPLVIVLCLTAHAIAWIGRSARVQTTILRAVLLAVGVGLTVRPIPIDHYDSTRREAQRAVAAIRDRLASAPPGESVYIPNRNVAGISVFVRREVFPGLAALCVIFCSDDDLRERHIFFTDSNADVLAAASQGRRSRELIVSPTGDR